MSQVITRKQLASLGLGSRAIHGMIEDGELERVERGVYRRARTPASGQQSLAEAAARVPGGVVCLVSALAFHRMGTQQPHEVWMAIHGKARQPRVDAPIRFVRFSGAAWTTGVDHVRIAGADVAVTTRAKTVADCFKFRSKVGLDVALEALRAFLLQRGRSMADLLVAADVCRVRNVMMPYLEALS